MAAGYLINRTPSAVLNGKTPYELLYKKAPPVNHIKVFGCLCYVHNQKHNGDKFASRTTKSVFLGYPLGKKGWRVYNLETRTISVSRDVMFCETEFPMSQVLNSSSSEMPASSPSPILILLMMNSQQCHHHLLCLLLSLKQWKHQYQSVSLQ